MYLSVVMSTDLINLCRKIDISFDSQNARKEDVIVVKHRRIGLGCSFGYFPSVIWKNDRKRSKYLYAVLNAKFMHKKALRYISLLRRRFFGHHFWTLPPKISQWTKFWLKSQIKGVSLIRKYINNIKLWSAMDRNGFR